MRVCTCESVLKVGVCICSLSVIQRPNTCLEVWAVGAGPQGSWKPPVFSRVSKLSAIPPEAPSSLDRGKAPLWPIARPLADKSGDSGGPVSHCVHPISIMCNRPLLQSGTSPNVPQGRSEDIGAAGEFCVACGGDSADRTA